MGPKNVSRQPQQNKQQQQQQQQQDPDCLGTEEHKIVLMGGGGVGKSCLTFRLVYGTFREAFDPTIEDSYRKKNFKVDEDSCCLEILDTAGQDTFAAMREIYYKSGNGFLLVFSVTDRSSMDDVRDRFQGILAATGTTPDTCPPIIVAGNKCDVTDGRVVSYEQGLELVHSMAGGHVGNDNIVYMETSALSNLNVNELFEEMVRRIRARNSKARQEGLEKLRKQRKPLKRCIII